MHKNILSAVGMTTLLIITIFPPMTIGDDHNNSEKKTNVESYNRYMYPEFYNSISIDEIDEYLEYQDADESSAYKLVESYKSLDSPPMDSPWPMYCHDSRHTGLSPYSTVDTWDEVWNYSLSGYSYHSSPVIDNEGVIYVGRGDLYAINPNGTLKWKYDLPGSAFSAPAIDENGIIYIGTRNAEPNYLFAIYPSNGTFKWKYRTGHHISSSPAIGSDGTIFISDWNGYIHAVYRNNGTCKWKYHTSDVSMSSPAIGEDGTIYCGSCDNKVYAFYPNNGTVKWKYKTGAWVHGSPTIADDGIIYIGSDDKYLYAFYPNNGTVKWRCGIGYVWGSPALDKEGIIYVGTWNMQFFAIYPNGTIKWNCDAPGRIWFGISAAISAEGIIFFGTTEQDGGEGRFISLNSDGTERWRVSGRGLFETSPAIGRDGTVYACTTSSYNRFYAFGVGDLDVDANGPYYGLVNESVQFDGCPGGGHSPLTYQWKFGDTHTSDEEDPTHIYIEPGNYTVTLIVTDNASNTSIDITWAWIQDGNNPPDNPYIDGPSHGDRETSYDYNITGTDSDGSVIYLFIDWDDDSNSGWIGPYDSGKKITLSHTWLLRGTYNIKCKTKDVYNAESNWTEFEVVLPRNKVSNNSLFLRFLERFPMLERLLSIIRVI